MPSSITVSARGFDPRYDCSTQSWAATSSSSLIGQGACLIGVRLIVQSNPGKPVEVNIIINNKSLKHKKLLIVRTHSMEMLMLFNRRVQVRTEYIARANDVLSK